MARKVPNEPEPMNVSDDDMSEEEEGGRRIAGIYIPPPIKPYCSSESVGPRLIITKISNQNFKSYAETVILSPFHHKFNAIIGPNGNGKSNVIDAILFVFGYRAQKIRSEKISILIHKSNKHPNYKFCRVDVHFHQIIEKPDGTFEVVPKSDFVIGRIGYEDNSSEYLMNGRKTNFREVSDLLKGYGIDLDHNRFLILQGEVESIATMKHKGANDKEVGLLEYLEDIIGTTRYKKPLFKLNELVEKLNESRADKHNRCKLAEREMKDLDGPMKKAVEYLELENAFFRTQNLQCQKYICNTRNQITEAEGVKTTLDEELKTHDAQYADSFNEQKEKEKIIEENIKKKEALVKRKEDMQTALKAAERKYIQTQESLVAANNRRKTLKTQLEKELQRLEDFKKVPEKNKREITESEQQIEKLSKQKSELDTQLEKNLAKLEEETAELQQQKEALSTKLAELKEKSDAAKASLLVKEQELKVLTSARTTEIRKYETLKNCFLDTKQELEEKKQNVVQVKQDHTKAKSELEKILRQYQSHQQQEKELTEEVRVLRSKIEQNNQEMQAQHTHGKVLDFLMKQKMNNVLPGVIGRLGDLGAIDPKYDVAISNACGKLDNIVVDTVDTAQACIEALRKHNVGQATFIALEKMQQFQTNVKQKIKTPEDVPRLFDLVKVEDESILPAFYFALRDTVVVNDLDQGYGIAYGAHRWRVVTLQGVVIETSGTMTGGGSQVIRGKMGQKIRSKTKEGPSMSRNELEGMKVEAEKLQNNINELQREQGEMEKQIGPLKSLIKQKGNEIQQLENNIVTTIAQLPKLEEQVKRQEQIANSTKSDASAEEPLKKEIEKLRKAFEKSLKATNELQTEVTGIDQQITDINNKQVKGLRDKIKDLTKQIDKLNSNVNKLRAEVDANERNTKKVEELIQNCQTEIATTETSIREYVSVRDECSEDKTKIEQKLKELEEELSNTDTGFGDLKKEIAALLKKENEGRMIRLEIEQKLETVIEQIDQLRKKIPHWEKKLRALKLHEIPNAEAPEPFKQYTEAELDGYSIADIQFQYTSQEEQLSGEKPNLSVIDEFSRKRQLYLERVRDLEDITAKRNEMRQTYEEVRQMRFTEFMVGFTIIAKKLKEMYQTITLGGDAELELVDSMDPFSEGVNFSVRPPRKSWKSISNLSGGEKTLSSLALVFALHYYKPSPLYFMDEIDAALDFRNVSVVANYIRDRTKNAQFIIISLRYNMFEMSDRLVGIYKSEDCSSAVAMNNVLPSRPSLTQATTQRPIVRTAAVTMNNVLPSRPSLSSPVVASVPAPVSVLPKRIPKPTEKAIAAAEIAKKNVKSQLKPSNPRTKGQGTATEIASVATQESTTEKVDGVFKVSPAKEKPTDTFVPATPDTSTNSDVSKDGPTPIDVPNFEDSEIPDDSMEEVESLPEFELNATQEREIEESLSDGEYPESAYIFFFGA